MTKVRDEGEAQRSSTFHGGRQLALFDEGALPADRRTTAIATSDICKRCEETYLTVDEVAKRYGASRASIWRWVVSQPSFPKPIKLSPGTTRWKLGDLTAFEAVLQRSGV